MSTPIAKEEFFRVAKTLATDRQVKQMQDVVEFIEESTCLKLAYTRAKTHHTCTASYVRPDGGRCKIFSFHANGQALCQHKVALPDHLSHEQKSAIRDAYLSYRDATGGADGTTWQWFSISSTSLSVLTTAIGGLTSALESVLRPT